MFFRIFQHLLPKARAWNITADKQLREFFEGLIGIGTDIKAFFDEIYNDLDPQQTRELAQGELQFGLPDTGLTEQERRDRLGAAWKANGGQSPRYIQDTLQNAGFDVYVHDWWEPGTEPAVGVKSCVTPRSPIVYLRRSSVNVVYTIECGEAIAECGEADAECGETSEPPGYPLVNKILITEPDVIPLCGEAIAECGEVDAGCGNYIDLVSRFLDYIVPLDSTKWPYFLYIGGQVFGDLATVDPKRRDEFETLCLKICPAHAWLGILVTYT